MKNDLFDTKPLAEIVKELNGLLDVKIESPRSLFKYFDRELAGWTRLPGYLEMSDIEIYDVLTKEVSPIGQLIFVTDASYFDERGGFIVDSGRALEFVRSHFDFFGDIFFSTDAMIYSPTQRRVWVLHHEGVYTTAVLA